MQVSLDDAYAEACRALGESIVRERLLSRALAEQQETGQAIRLGKDIRDLAGEHPVAG